MARRPSKNSSGGHAFVIKPVAPERMAARSISSSSSDLNKVSVYNEMTCEDGPKAFQELVGGTRFRNKAGSAGADGREQHLVVLLRSEQGFGLQRNDLRGWPEGLPRTRRGDTLS